MNKADKTSVSPVCSSSHTQHYEEDMGKFDPMNLVIHLHSSVASMLDSGQPEITNFADPRAKAFATYLHETIHWWQHIGTTSGLISGLRIPVQCHMSQGEIKALTGKVIPQKSMLKYYDLAYRTLPADTMEELNVIVNSWSDLEFGHAVLVHPEKVLEGLNTGRTVPPIGFFESVGHSVGWQYLNTVNILAASLDRSFTSLPDIRQWQHGFDDLKQRRITNWYFRSKVTLPPLGRQAIAEAQARFQEIQFLSLVSEGELSWEDFEERDFVTHRYAHAFTVFLAASGLDFPAHPLSPLVDLFMVVCDIALNPNVGYPDEIRNYEQFVEEVSPGVRFLFAANIVRKLRGLEKKLKRLDREDYDEVAGAICGPMGTKTPRECAATIVKMSEGMPAIKELKKEMFEGVMRPQAMPIRFCFGKHLSLMHDKSRHPEYFCWPAAHCGEFNGSRDLNHTMKLFHQHSCPFIRTSIDGEVRANEQQFVDSVSAAKLVATYFRWQIHYDLFRQWVSKDGPFKFDYQWIDPAKNTEELRNLASEDFVRSYGVDLNSIRLATSTE